MSLARTELPFDHMLAGRYRIADRLGAGGMAVVFLAEDTVLDRWVAIKRLRAAAPKNGAERFDREAKLGAWLNHPNLVTIYDTLSDEDDVLIVMEYVPGRSLSQLIEHRPVEPGRAVAVLRGVAAALDHAHSHGVVHRDVKPSNVLIRDDGVVKLADLGVATAAHVSRITTVSDVVGTLAYIAPERLEGEGEAGPPADVYSLAAVAFESLSGRRAQRGSGPAEILEIAASRPPPDLRDAWRKAPAAAAEVLRRGLSADPDERPGSASELVRELEGALEPVMESTPSQPAVAPTAAAERRGRTEVTINVPRPGRIATLVASLALAAAGIVIGLNLARDEEPPAERAAAGGPSSPHRDSDGGDTEANAPAPEAPAENPEPAEAASGAGNPAVGGQLNEQGYALIQQGRYEEAVPILRRAVESFPEGTRDLNYAYTLYNLGQALRLSGQPDEAVPILEQRLEIPNQRGTVKRELEAARAQAAQ
jgi:eukaryotic-like serine/threonine-protein kinase